MVGKTIRCFFLVLSKQAIILVATVGIFCVIILQQEDWRS